jgi:hypothetical protein
MFQPCRFLVGAMAEAPAKTEEYVSARFRTLRGRERTLTFPRDTELGLFLLHAQQTKTTEREAEGESERKRETNSDRQDADGAVPGFLEVPSGRF